MKVKTRAKAKVKYKKGTFRLLIYWRKILGEKNIRISGTALRDFHSMRDDAHQNRAQYRKRQSGSVNRQVKETFATIKVEVVRKFQESIEKLHGRNENGEKNRKQNKNTRIQKQNVAE